MGIIGVVAALTLPNLNSSTGSKEKVAKIKKIYTNLSDAIGRAQAVYGPIDEWSSSIAHGARITEFMKISKDCGVEDEKAFTWVPVGDFFPLGSGSHFYLLADGTGLAIANHENRNEGLPIMIDIYGAKKGKGQYNDDIIRFYYL